MEIIGVFGIESSIFFNSWNLFFIRITLSEWERGFGKNGGITTFLEKGKRRGSLVDSATPAMNAEGVDESEE
jgi:hypothetical protein